MLFYLVSRSDTVKQEKENLSVAKNGGEPTWHWEAQLGHLAYHKELFDLIADMVCADPKKRPTVAQVIEKVKAFV
jgi:hypothetical protein